MNKVTDLLNKPLWQLTGSEYLALHRYAHEKDGMNSKECHPITRVTGVHALAQYIECSDSQVYKLRREGVLDEAIISHVGKSIVFDGEKARELAQAFMEESRAKRDNQ